MNRITEDVFASIFTVAFVFMTFAILVRLWHSTGGGWEAIGFKILLSVMGAALCYGMCGLFWSHRWK